MNPKTLSAFGLCGLLSQASATITLANGALTLGGLTTTSLSGGGLALTSGATTIGVTGAGLALGAVGLLGAAVVKGALLTQLGRRRGGGGRGRGFFGRRRGKRDATEAEADIETMELTAEEHAEVLSKIDAYFETIADLDIDDCGKKYVCEIETSAPEDRTPEESLIASLFGENDEINPESQKSEFDLAAHLGQATKSKRACSRRYHKCPVDRKTISQGFSKVQNE